VTGDALDRSGWRRGGAPRPASIALLPAGDRFEDFHARIGVSFEAFLEELTGGWLFNYVEALRAAGVETVLCFGSSSVERPVRHLHRPTGAPVWLLPNPRSRRVALRASARLSPRSMIGPALASYVSIPVRALRRVIRDEGCVALLTQEYESERFDVVAMLGRALRLPVFATYQGANRTAAAFERPIRKLAVRSASGLVVGASAEAERVRRAYGVPGERIASIPNPVDTTAWRPADRARARKTLGLPLDARVVEWHGHVQVERKGLDVLIDAWRRIRASRDGGEPILLLVGSGRGAPALRELIGADPSVRWADRYVLDRAELWTYLAASDVYVLPSRHEGFAVAPLEAMAAARPVVATDVSGVRDLFPDGRGDEPAMGGVVVPADDPAALADAIRALLDDDERARALGAEGRRRAEREYAVERVGPMLASFLLGGARRM
jgi:glycosyltransferase involved in cell wall biosynthesis